MVERKKPPRICEGTTAEIDSTSAVSIMNMTADWVADNPELWADLESWAANEAAHNRKFAIQEWAERIRWKRRVDRLGHDVKVNNSMLPCLSRMLTEQHPDLKAYIEQRHSILDSFFGKDGAAA